jgi:hypothetical protein
MYVYNIHLDKKLENDISSYSDKSFYLSHERKLLGLVNDMLYSKQLYETYNAIETNAHSNFTNTEIENIKDILNILDLNN